MTYTDMETALAEAERTLNICDSVATKLARLLVGRLRKVSSGHVLKQLKAELSNFDSRTCRWKS